MSAAGPPRIRHRSDAYVNLDLLAFMDCLFQVAVAELVVEQLTALGQALVCVGIGWPWLFSSPDEYPDCMPVHLGRQLPVATILVSALNIKKNLDQGL